MALAAGKILMIMFWLMLTRPTAPSISKLTFSNWNAG